MAEPEMSGLRARLAAVPAWAWLGGIVLASIVGRGLVARHMPAPFIMTDELSYSELAKGLAERGSFAIRDVASGGYGAVYPAVIFLAYAVFDRVPDAYAAIKAINVVVMSLAAVPAYLLARRALSQASSLIVAALAVAVPSLVYTTTVMTENVFYPLVILTLLFIVRLLEQPGWRRTVPLLALLVLALLTRVQAVALVAAALTAPLLLAAFTGRWRDLRRQAWLYGIVVGAGVLVVLAQVARGRPLDSLLGAYAVVGESEYDLGLALRYWLWHLEELTLYLGIVPVAALVVLLVRVRRLPEAARAHLAVTLSAVFWLSLVVAVFASRHASRIQERNLFFVAPLLFVVLLLWVEHRRRDRTPVLEAAAAAAAVVLAAVFPFTRFIETSATSDTLALLPLWSAYGSLLLDSVWATVAIGGAIAGVLFVLVPSRYAVVVPVALVAYLCVVSASVWGGERGFERAGIGALFQGIRSQPRDWIDEAVPPGATVAAIYTGAADRFTINTNEFFNRRVGPVYYTGVPTPGTLPETGVAVGADGVLRRVEDGRPLTERYVLVDSSLEIVGTVVARDVAAWGMTVWRVAGPVVRRQDVSVSGLYPNDTWAGPRVRYERRQCDGGSLVITLSSDPALFGAIESTVVARSGGTPAGRVRFGSSESAVLRIPLRPARGRCIVDLAIGPTRNPSRVLPGSTDDRELGAHVAISFVPAG